VIWVEVSFHLPIDRFFTYDVPDFLEKDIETGKRVLVPFKSARKNISIPLKVSKKVFHDLTAAIAEKENQDFFSSFYQESKKTMLFKKKEEDLLPLEMKKITEILKQLRASKMGVITKVIKEKPEFKTLSVLKILDPYPILPSYAMEISQWISNYYACSLNEALHLFVPSAKTPISAVIKQEHEIPFYPLNPEQEKVFQEIEKSKNQFFPVLIHGVTGSGKTEVYRHLVKKTVEEGKQALILVPEISLTPQTIERFAALFGPDKISVINSKMTASQKLHNFYRIIRKETPIILGPRSALFTPLNDLGMIIIDEEQEYSYKSGENPRYNAKQVALKIAQKLKIPVIFGSATPSVEAYYSALKGNIKLFELKKRYSDIVLPYIHIVDLKHEKGEFSKELIQKVVLNKKNGFQTILFLNRRGFAPTILCKSCGHQFVCPNCSVTLTFHKKKNLLSCHYCGYESRLSKKCPSCDNQEYLMSGLGTEKLEEELNNIFPNLKIVRMDRDTTAKRDSHEKLLKEFRSGKADILIGTQMIAKGLDFERVKLVGVISADISLNLPDFRSGENTFSLLTQVAGRSGRKTPGEVVLQTYSPSHYVILQVKNHDYISFFNDEIKLREKYLYPPFVRIIRLVVRGEIEEKVVKKIKELEDSLNHEKILFTGPVPCTIEKLNKNYRYHLFIKTQTVLPLVKKIKKITDSIYNDKLIYIEIDVDPVNML